MTANTESAAILTKTHELKTDPAVFAAVLSGAKTHEIRLNDRGFAVGDTLYLRETVSPGEYMKLGSPLIYTGRTATRIVSHIQTGYGLADDWCILSFAAVPVSEPVATYLQADMKSIGWAEVNAVQYEAYQASGWPVRTLYCYTSPVSAAPVVPSGEPVRLMNFGVDGPAPWSGAAHVVLVDRNAVLEEAAAIAEQTGEYDCDYQGEITATRTAAAIRALKSAAPASPIVPKLAVPQGWKLVPIKPTPEMVHAMRYSTKYAPPFGVEYDPEKHELHHFGTGLAEAAYCRALSASPEVAPAVQDAPSDEQGQQTLPVCHSALRAEPADLDKPCRNASINNGAKVWPKSCLRCGIRKCPDGIEANFEQTTLPAGTAGFSPTDSQVAAPVSGEVADELHFNAVRLRNVAKLVGLESAVPQDDATLDGARGAVLGQIAAKLREQPREMVNRFLGWPLPKTFAPDCGIAFTPQFHGWPTGTNLMNVVEARAMFEYALGLSPDQATGEPQ
jgi:hypothetical protein